MISLRLSEEEYDAMLALYSTHGARSISDFARDAIRRVLTNSQALDNPLASRVHELGERLNLVEQRVSAFLAQR